MKNSSISDYIVKGVCDIIAGIVFLIPIIICACIPILGWAGVFPLINMQNSMSESLFNKYKEEITNRSKQKNIEKKDDKATNKISLEDEDLKTLKHKEEEKQKDKLKNWLKETIASEDTSLIEDLSSISKKIKFKIPIKKKNTKSLKHKEEVINKVKKDTPTNISALSDDLTKLGELKEKGLLTEEEFNEQKKKLLKQ